MCDRPVNENSVKVSPSSLSCLLSSPPVLQRFPVPRSFGTSSSGNPVITESDKRELVNRRIQVRYRVNFQPRYVRTQSVLQPIPGGISVRTHRCRRFSQVDKEYSMIRSLRRSIETIHGSINHREDVISRVTSPRRDLRDENLPRRCFRIHVRPLDGFAQFSKIDVTFWSRNDAVVVVNDRIRDAKNIPVVNRTNAICSS